MSHANKPKRVLITGAAGSVGTALRHSFGAAYEHLRLNDIAPMTPAAPHEEVMRADMRDMAALAPV
ncbi:MAG: hypothetical protein AAF337_15635, partial [Pseudomonadota bacterium]